MGIWDDRAGFFVGRCHSPATSQLWNFQLDLTGTLSANSTSSPSSTGHPEFLYYTTRNSSFAHAILCVVGFLALVPAGALLRDIFVLSAQHGSKDMSQIQAFICKVALWSLVSFRIS